MTRGEVIAKIREMGYAVTHDYRTFTATKGAITLQAGSPMGLLKKIKAL